MGLINATLFIEFTSILSFIIATIIFHKRRRFKNAKPARLPPGPKGYPFIGSSLEMAMKKPTFRWIHKLMQQMNTEIVCIRLGNTHVVAVSSPELAREFLNKHDADFASRPNYMSSRVPSSGYLTAVFSPSGEQWKKMKRIVVAEVLSPAMHRWLHDKRMEESDHLVQHLYTRCGVRNGLVNVRALARHYCGNVLRKTMFGKRFFGPGTADGGPGYEEDEHVEGLFNVLARSFGFGISDYLPWLEVLDLDGSKKGMTDSVYSVRKYQDPEIANRVKMWKGGFREKNEDILDVLINLKNSENKPLLSLEELQAQILELMLAGIDNPANAIEWILAEIINQPHILDKAREELDTIVGKTRLVQESDLPKLNYVKACIKESFRLHPMAPFNVPHASTKDTVVGSYFIPKGSHVLVSRIGLGRNPMVWDDPLLFKPQRHINDQDSEVVLTDPELRMLTFSRGRRGCPGFVLGTTMSTMLLARLIHGFIWKPPPGLTRVPLDESEHELALAKPLIAYAMPRLESKLYQL